MGNKALRSEASADNSTSQQNKGEAVDPTPRDSIDSSRVLPRTSHTFRTVKEGRRNILGDLAVNKTVQLGKSRMNANEQVQHQNEPPAGEQSNGTTHGCRDGQSYRYIYGCSYVSQSVAYEGPCETCRNFENLDGRGEWSGAVKNDSNGSDNSDDEELLPLGDGPDVCVLNRCYSPTLEDYLPLSSQSLSNVVGYGEGEPQCSQFRADASGPVQVHEQHVVDLESRRRHSFSVCPGDVKGKAQVGVEPSVAEAVRLDVDPKDRLGAFTLLQIRNAPNWGKVTVQAEHVLNDCDHPGLGFRDNSNLKSLARMTENIRSSLATVGKKVAPHVVSRRLKIVNRSSAGRIAAKFDKARKSKKATNSNLKVNFTAEVVPKRLKIVAKGNTESVGIKVDQANNSQMVAIDNLNVKSWIGRKKRAYASLKEINHRRQA